MDWWEAFKLSEFLKHPMIYAPPGIDLWLSEWKNWLDLFMQTNPWFCFFMGTTGMTWLTWLVMKTPWNWDDKWPDWVKRHIFKEPVSEEKKAEVRATVQREVHVLTDEIIEKDKPVQGGSS